MKPSDITTGYYKPSFSSVIEALNTDGWAKFETEHRHKDGTVIPFEINAHIAKLQDKRYDDRSVSRYLREQASNERPKDREREAQPSFRHHPA